jgi:hypothetical protein
MTSITGPSRLVGEELALLAPEYLLAGHLIDGCEAVADGEALVIGVVLGDDEVPESDEVVLTRFSTGATHRFESRGTPVEIRPAPVTQ